MLTKDEIETLDKFGGLVDATQHVLDGAQALGHALVGKMKILGGVLENLDEDTSRDQIDAALRDLTTLADTRNEMLCQASFLLGNAIETSDIQVRDVHEIAGAVRSEVIYE